jgi:hypothetical protein
MTSAAKLVLGVSILSMATGFAACDSGGENTGTAGSGPITAAGSGNQGTAGAPPSGAGAASGGAAGGPAMEGVALTPVDGWVDSQSNGLLAQGAVFAFGDETSKMGMVEDFKGSNACIKGTAAKVDTASDVCKNMTFTPPAKDCYGQYWGAAIGMNLNQPIDPATGEGVVTPLPFDATAVKGFTFTVAGNTVPAPGSFRFKVEDGTKEYCNPAAIKVKVGVNTVLFSDLVSECWAVMTPPAPTAETAKKNLIKISWQVVTNTSSTVLFDFCISDVRAILVAGGTLPLPMGAGGAPSGTAGAGPAGGSGGAAAGAPAGGSGGAAAGAPAGGSGGAAAGAPAGGGGSGGTAG